MANPGAGEGEVSCSQSAADQLADAKRKLADLRATPNKTQAQADQVTQLEKQVKHLQKKAAEKSETHSRNAKGQQQ